MIRIAVEVGHLKGIEILGERRERRNTYTGEIDGAELHLLDHRFLFAELDSRDKLRP